MTHHTIAVGRHFDCVLAAVLCCAFVLAADEPAARAVEAGGFESPGNCKICYQSFVLKNPTRTKTNPHSFEGDCGCICVSFWICGFAFGVKDSGLWPLGRHSRSQASASSLLLKLESQPIMSRMFSICMLVGSLFLNWFHDQTEQQHNPITASNASG